MYSNLLCVFVLVYTTRLFAVICGVVDWNVKSPKICFSDISYSWPESDTATEVSTRIEIHDIFDINEAKMHFGLQVKLFLLWRDPVVNLDDINITKAEMIPEKVSKCIWKPDVTFRVCKEATLYEDTLPHSVFKLMPGNLFYHYARFQLLVSCRMKFHSYPMDVQRCKLGLEFLYSRNEDAILVWMHKSSEELARNIGGVKVMDNVQLSKFSLKTPHLYERKFAFKSGNATNLYCDFIFSRHITSSLINTYIPSFLVVCLSFVSFWLDVKAVPGRVTLGVTALLTLATQMDSARISLPSVNYMTALDIWLFGCLLLVFLSLLEFVLANSSARFLDQSKVYANEKKLKNYDDSKGGDAWKIVGSSPGTEVNKHLKKSNSTSSLQLMTHNPTSGFDKISRVLFPIVLVVFIIFYYVYFKNV